VSPPWSCSVVGTFAWRTCTERWPKIVAAVADDVPGHRAALVALRDEIAHGVVSNHVDEGGRWRAVDEFVGQRWTALPWYLGESFLYARVRAAVGYGDSHADPFLATKQREERTLPALIQAGIDDGDLDGALWRSLWGNRADLSLPSAMQHKGDDADDLVADERAAARALVDEAGVVGVVLDNAGLELARDLALARLLRRRGKRVILFAKDAPFFVSDALPADIARTRALCGIDDGSDVVVAEFFTGPGFLRTPSLPRSLVDAFAGCDVVVAKGDCNYRRLVGDGAPSDEAFADVVDFPAPLIALRTLKAEVLVGGDPARVAAARARDVDWLVSGRFGLVQVASSPPPRASSPSA
jgi:uncharacterized protein with ATP-grasp and redox domains